MRDYKCKSLFADIDTAQKSVMNISRIYDIAVHNHPYAPIGQCSANIFLYIFKFFSYHFTTFYHKLYHQLKIFGVFWIYQILFKHSFLETPTLPTLANNWAVHHLHHEVTKCLKAIGDSVLKMLVNKLVNVVIRG